MKKAMGIKLKSIKNKKGFTMIEIIVVLVILAVLAAVSIPALIGFVDEARGKAYINEARAGMIAAQAVVTEQTALSTDGKAPDEADILKSQTFKNMVSDVGGKFKTIKVDRATEISTSGVKVKLNRVEGLEYESGDGKYKITITSTGTAVEKIGK